MASMTKTVVVYNPSRLTREAWLPVLWAQAKTYYERHGNNQWTWAPCYADSQGHNIEETKRILTQLNPDVFAVSLYVWNYQIAHSVMSWVKSNFPKCVIVTGGPHQYFKHNDNWFQDYPYIDASLPGDSYGEICFKEILDNLDADNRIDWNTVSNICFPYGNSRFKKYSTKQYNKQTKKEFDYNWSAIQSQFNDLKNYVSYVKSFDPETTILSIVESTRGCPYGCTYCDWGGGINTSVVQKPMDAIKQDIDALCKLDLSFLYFADANFGIFGQRDVDIIRYLAKQRNRHSAKFTVGYGGFAKTENKLEYIREILKTDIENKLSALGEFKISIQTLDPDVLKRIDRKNVPLQKQIEVLQSLGNIQRLPLHVELIYGLPGMTIDKFYYELDVLGDQQLSIQWYPWILLPEAPSYSRQYRKQEQIQTVVKNVGWWWSDDYNTQNEIVVETSTYSKDQYLEMLLASGFYKLFVQGGYLKHILVWLKQHNVGIGQLVRDIFKEFLNQNSWMQQAQTAWKLRALADPNSGCFIKIDHQDVYLGLYFVAISFLHYQEFTIPLTQWIQKKYQCPQHIIDQDLACTVHQGNYGTVKWQGLHRIDYRKSKFGTDPLNDILLQMVQFKQSGHIFHAQKRLLGLIS